MEALIESAANLVQGEHVDASGGELDCESNSIEPPADVTNDAGVPVGQHEPGIYCSRAFDKQRDRSETERCLGRAQRAYRRRI